MIKRIYNNPDPTGDFSAGAPRDVVNAEFAKRLQYHINQKGWNQSELARRATERAPEGTRIGRDNISTYIRGRVLPGPLKLRAIADALGVEPGDLVPKRGMPTAADRNPPFDIRQLEDGNVWLRVNRAVSWKTGHKVMALLAEEDEGIAEKE